MAQNKTACKNLGSGKKYDTFNRKSTKYCTMQSQFFEII